MPTANAVTSTIVHLRNQYVRCTHNNIPTYSRCCISGPNGWRMHITTDKSVHDRAGLLIRCWQISVVVFGCVNCLSAFVAVTLSYYCRRTGIENNHCNHAHICVVCVRTCYANVFVFPDALKRTHDVRVRISNVRQICATICVCCAKRLNSFFGFVVLPGNRHRLYAIITIT